MEPNVGPLKEFEAKLEKVELMNTRFHKIRSSQLIDFIVLAGQMDRKTTIGYVNIKAMNLSHELPWYREFVNRANLVFCDGFGVLWAAKLFGYKLQSEHRMTCPDYLENLAKACAQADVSMYLLTGTQDIIDTAIDKLSAIAPGLKIGGHTGYFKKTGEETNRVIEEINAFKPGVIYIGFGTPLQERWLYENRPRIDARVFMPLGACLEFYVGTMKRGPRWMTDSGLEWFYRLATEPKRLWKRYVVGIPLFFYRLLKYEWIHRRLEKPKKKLA